ncbi:hypothetical protein DIS24_g6750 [Lasiodiplodia hormozganensis]|uniref:Secreted protein n=2 Tax=Lasiodiplodia hormozganensis TaxID=869390 RepID=A0AA39YDD8_9PEZI|nr:hypothetical protein DIS24_g6750 [Lasiodiplodia hormozganensis]
MNDLLWSVRRGLATGISMNVLHGSAYSGPYANTTWPSYTTFTYRYTEMWNQNQPAWQHMNDTIMYIARNQYVAQIGTPKVDLAFYQYSSPWAAKESYQNTNLQNLGYTYEYISAGNLQSEDAVMEDGVLARSGPAYKALIFSNQTSITPAAATKIKQFALGGLPIFFVGSANLTSIGKKPGDAQSVSSTMDEILSAGPNVHTVNSAEELPEALKAASILPKTSFPAPMVGWFTFWRKTENADYVFLYNDGSETQTSEVTFNTSGTPYLFDAWTGSVSPVLRYSSTASTISIPITLTANQTSIIGFATSGSNGTTTFPPAPETFISSMTGGVKGLRYNGSAILAQVSGPGSVVLSSGKAVNVTASPPGVSNLTSWDIAIQDWHRTNNTFSMETAIDLHTYTNSTLAPWKSLDPALAGVSGIGTYSTQFAYPTSTDGEHRLGALLHLGPILNTVRVSLNGEILPPADVSIAVIDMTEYLHAGENDLRIEVASTLFNRIKADGNATWTAGVTANEENSRFYEVNEYKEFGLVGPVWVEWVTEAVVA